MQTETNEQTNKLVITTKRSSQGLREMLFDELDNIRNGKSNPQRANAITKASAVILDSAKLEVQYAKFMNELGNGKNTVDSIKLA